MTTPSPALWPDRAAGRDTNCSENIEICTVTGLKHLVPGEACEGGTEHQHQVRLVSGRPPLAEHVLPVQYNFSTLYSVPQLPDIAIVAHDGVGGIVPGAVQLRHQLLWEPGLLGQPAQNCPKQETQFYSTTHRGSG